MTGAPKRRSSAARTAEVHGIQLRFEPLPHKNTLGFWTRKDDWASWEFEIAKPGKFAVEVLQGCGKGSGGSDVELSVAGDELDYLFFDWLKALLSLFDERRLLLVKFDVTVGDDGLKAVCEGEAMDETRHEPSHEVKAITYHALRVEKGVDGWLAEVIVDI